jgi:hypothetical protein
MDEVVAPKKEEEENQTLSIEYTKELCIVNDFTVHFVTQV